MEILEKIFKLKSKNTISSNHFYIGDGGLVFYNIYIPLDAVSIVKLREIEKESLVPYIALILFGLFLCSAILLPGLVVAILGGVLCYRTWCSNQEELYKLLIYLNNGQIYTLAYGDLDYTIQIVDLIRQCVADKSKIHNVYVNNGTSTYIKDESVGKICGNIFKGSVGNIAAGDDIKQYNEPAGEQRGKADERLEDDIKQYNELLKISNGDRRELKYFLEDRQMSFDENSNEYEICNTLIDYINKRQYMELKKYIGNLVKERKINTIFGMGVNPEIRARILAILRKIMEVK